MNAKIPANSLKTSLLKKTGARAKKLSDATDIAALVAKTGNKNLLPDVVPEHHAIVDLVPASAKLRKPVARQINKLAASIGEHGFQGAIMVRGNTIVDGHARVAAMKELGQSHIRAIDVGAMDDAQCKLLALSLNRLGEIGEWDVEVLRETMIEIEAVGLDLDITGFDAIEIDTIKLDPIDETSSELDELPKPLPGAPVSLAGDVWLLGDHRLLCGSATDAADWTVLTDGKRAAALICDPPYNVVVSGNVSGLGKVKHGEFVEASGEKTPEEYRAFLTNFLALSRDHLDPAAVAFAFIDWRGIANLHLAGDAAGFTLINMIVWDKKVGAMGGLYRSAHELIAVFCNGAASPKTNNVKLGKHGRNRTNVWYYPGANRPGSDAAKMLANHPTPKPVAMIADAMLDVTMKGEIVVDCFMGSGTAIIAGIEAGRIVYGIEKDPKYVDLAVRRWELVTGGTAKLAASGETFAEVRIKRMEVSVS